jgi:hypothetical protein
MCGAVTVQMVPGCEELHVCHCDMCRRWTGVALMVIAAKDGTLSHQGPVKSLKSSDWAERAWCDACGSSLWYKLTIPGHETYNVAAGLFENAGGFPLRKEIYIDRKPGGFAFAGDHERKTKQDVEATFASYGEDTAQ